MKLSDMENIIDNLKKLKNKKSIVFSESYYPDEIHYRDSEIKKIMNNILSGYNSCLIGDIGSGKTLCTKWIFNILEKKNKNMKFIYYNCKHSNYTELFIHIIKIIGSSVKRRHSSKYYLDILNDLIKEKNIERIVLCLDEIDFLLNKYSYDSSLLYPLVNEEKINLILIANTTSWLNNMESRTYDRLKINTINFTNYNKEEIRGILEQRIEIGIETEEKKVSLKEIKHISDIIFETNNTIREGILIISKIYDYKKLSNMNIDLDSTMIKNLLKQVKDEGEIARFRVLKNQLKNCIMIITEICKKKRKNEVILQDLFKKIKNKSHQTIRNYLRELVSYGFLKIKKISSRGKKSYSYAYIPLFDIEEFDMYIKTLYLSEI